MAGADITRGQDLIAQGQFEQAFALLSPMARSGNAQAEELMGVLYALGLGVDTDPARAFEWYLRAAQKGHPGAQSHVAAFYEAGIGLASADLMRAYVWYTLSARGGAADAAASLQAVAEKLSQDQIDTAHSLIDDYQSLFDPFD